MLARNGSVVVSTAGQDRCGPHRPHVSSPILKKIVRRSKKYHAHVEGNVAVEGERITIRECPPRSKTEDIGKLLQAKGDS